MKHLTCLLIILLLTIPALSQKHSDKKTTQTLELDTTKVAAYKTALQTAMQMSWEINFSDPTIHSFGGTTPSLMSRWDDKVNVSVIDSENGIIIKVKSQLGHKPNVEYIKSYLDRIKSEFKPTNN